MSYGNLALDGMRTAGVATHAGAPAVVETVVSHADDLTRFAKRSPELSVAARIMQRLEGAGMWDTLLPRTAERPAVAGLIDAERGSVVPASRYGTKNPGLVRVIHDRPLGALGQGTEEVSTARALVRALVAESPQHTRSTPVTIIQGTAGTGKTEMFERLHALYPGGGVDLPTHL